MGGKKGRNAHAGLRKFSEKVKKRTVCKETKVELNNGEKGLSLLMGRGGWRKGWKHKKVLIPQDMKAARLEGGKKKPKRKAAVSNNSLQKSSR